MEARKSQTLDQREAEKNRLTCKGEAGLPADDGPERVGGEALIRSSILVFVQMADSEVSSRKAVVGSRFGIDFCAIQFPSEKKR